MCTHKKGLPRYLTGGGRAGDQSVEQNVEDNPIYIKRYTHTQNPKLIIYELDEIVQK